MGDRFSVDYFIEILILIWSNTHVGQMVYQMDICSLLGPMGFIPRKCPWEKRTPWSPCPKTAFNNLTCNPTPPPPPRTSPGICNFFSFLKVYSPLLRTQKETKIEKTRTGESFTGVSSWFHIAFTCLRYPFQSTRQTDFKQKRRNVVSRLHETVEKFRPGVKFSPRYNYQGKLKPA